MANPVKAEPARLLTPNGQRAVEAAARTRDEVRAWGVRNESLVTYDTRTVGGAWLTAHLLDEIDAQRQLNGDLQAAVASEIQHAEDARRIAGDHQSARDALRELMEGVYAISMSWEDCDDCHALAEYEPHSDQMCAQHGPKSHRLYHAMVAAEQLLGPCGCGHDRAGHYDEDTTRCRTCDCQAFRLPDVAPPPVPSPGEQT